MTTEATTKPRWVEIADRAAEALDRASGMSNEPNVQGFSLKDAELREADAWMRLAVLYRDGHERKLTN